MLVLVIMVKMSARIAQLYKPENLLLILLQHSRITSYFNSLIIKLFGDLILFKYEIENTVETTMHLSDTCYFYEKS